MQQRAVLLWLPCVAGAAAGRLLKAKLCGCSQLKAQALPNHCIAGCRYRVTAYPDWPVERVKQALFKVRAV